MDNFRFDVTARSADGLRTILTWIFGALGPNMKTTGYRLANVAEKPTLILYHAKCESATPFPAGLGADATCHFVSAWLDEAERGKEPDIDGSVAKGWQLYNEDWGHVGGEWEAYAAVRPIWALIGK